jgi:hypothetical protein
MKKQNWIAFEQVLIGKEGEKVKKAKVTMMKGATGSAVIKVDGKDLISLGLCNVVIHLDVLDKYGLNILAM